MGRLRYIPSTPEMILLLSLMETPEKPVNRRTAKRLSRYPFYVVALDEAANDPRRWVLTERGRKMMEGLTGWIEAFKYGQEREKELAKMRWPPDGIQPGVPRREDDDE